jgi:hypothetical protein
MEMAKYKQEILDKLVGKAVSRKLLVWLVATIGVPLHFVNGEQWIQISMIYIGSQAAMDFVLQYAKVKQGGSSTPQT